MTSDLATFAPAAITHLDYPAVYLYKLLVHLRHVQGGEALTQVLSHAAHVSSSSSSIIRIFVRSLFVSDF